MADMHASDCKSVSYYRCNMDTAAIEVLKSKITDMVRAEEFETAASLKKQLVELQARSSRSSPSASIRAEDAVEVGTRPASVGSSRCTDSGAAEQDC